MNTSPTLRLKDLRREVREMVHTAALALRPDNDPLHLLVALETDSFLKPGEFMSVVKIYRSINARVTEKNEEILQKTVRGKRAWKLKHIHIIWEHIE